MFILSTLAAITVYDSKHNGRDFNSYNNVYTWSDYTVNTTSTESTLTGTIYIIDSNNNILSFYTSHQNVELYCNGELLYNYPISNDNIFAKTPGYAWNFVSLPVGENQIEIRLTSCYKYYIARIPDFYYGNIPAITSKIIDDNLASFAICTVVLFFGICVIIFWLTMHKNSLHSATLLYLGIFAVILSIWSLNESRLSILIIKNNIAASYIAFDLLLLLPLPFAQFVKYFYKSNSKIWDIYSICSLVNAVVCTLLQLWKLLDLRETLWTSHTMILILALIVIWYSIKMLNENNENNLIRVHLICICIYAFSLFMDMIAFYVGVWDNNTFGRIGLLIYFVVVGLSTLQESTDLMKMGLQTKAYEKIAYTDQLTGLANRAAFIRDIDKLNEAKEDIALMNLDINNLKRTNDNYGHYNGDIYIKAASEVIQNVFSKIGICYRIGGDEFEVIVPKSSYYNLDKYMLQLDKEMVRADFDGKMTWMHIAHGYCIFDSNVDDDLMDTYKRADVLMYIDKENKKSQDK